MVGAGWLRSYAFTAGVGHHLAWHRGGAQHAVLLKDLAGKFGLADSEPAPLHFHMACNRMKMPAGVEMAEIDSPAREFWLQCVRALEFETDPEALYGMVHLVNGWGPDAETASTWDE